LLGPETGGESISGPTIVNIFFAITLGVASILQLFVKEDLRRQEAENSVYMPRENSKSDSNTEL